LLGETPGSPGPPPRSSAEGRPLSAPPILLASTSPQRRAILGQLGIPFEVVAPSYEEHGDDPVEHAAGKARSVDSGNQPVLGVDTIVRCAGRVLGKPGGAKEAAEMLGVLSGRTHEVVSGLCLRTDSWEELDSETTLVTFRPLTAHDIAAYISSGEWRIVPGRTRSRGWAPHSSSASRATT